MGLKIGIEFMRKYLNIRKWISNKFKLLFLNVFEEFFNQYSFYQLAEVSLYENIEHHWNIGFILWI